MLAHHRSPGGGRDGAVTGSDIVTRNNSEERNACVVTPVAGKNLLSFCAEPYLALGAAVINVARCATVYFSKTEAEWVCMESCVFLSQYNTVNSHCTFHIA